jgi:hypothetical protein
MLTASVTSGSGWCCGSTFDFEGSGVAPVIGATSFGGTWLGGCSGVPLPTTTCMRTLTVRLVARSGDVLSLSEEAIWEAPVQPEPPPTWTVDQASSTGRFATYSGSGTYSVDEPASGGVTIWLSGNLLPAP